MNQQLQQHIINPKCVQNFVIWDTTRFPALFFNFDNKTSHYQLLDYKLKNEMGSYAYSNNLEDIKELRENLIRLQKFKPLELVISKMSNFNIKKSI